MGHHRGLVAGAADGRLDQPLLSGQQLRGRPAALLQRPLGHHADRLLGQEPVGQPLELGPRGAGQLPAHRSEHVLAGEGRRGRGQPVRTSQPVEHRGHRPLGHHQVLRARPADHLPDHGVRVQAALGRLRPPPPIEGVRALVLLGLASGLDSPLDQPRCPLPPLGLEPLHLQVDLVGALGEQPDQVLGHALQLPVAVPVGHRPLHPQRPTELALVGGPVDGIGGQPMPVQVPAVQGRPASVRPLDPVGHHQMGVHQRVTLPACPVVEPHGQQPLSGHVLVSAVATARPNVGVQIRGRLGHPGVMSGQHRPTGHRVAETVEDRDALGRAQDYVERRDGVAAVRAAEELPSRGVAALEHRLESGRRCFALQAEAGGAGAIPGAWGLPVARQVLLVIGGQLASEILLATHRELGDVGHHPAASLPPRWRQQRTPGALLSSERFRVERRANGEASSVMTSARASAGWLGSGSVGEAVGRWTDWVGS